MNADGCIREGRQRGWSVDRNTAYGGWWEEKVFSPTKNKSVSIYWALSVYLALCQGFPGDANGKEPTCQCRRCKRHEFHLWVGKIPWRRKRQPTLVFLPGQSHGQRSLAGYSPRGCKESDNQSSLAQAQALCQVSWKNPKKAEPWRMTRMSLPCTPPPPLPESEKIQR